MIALSKLYSLNDPRLAQTQVKGDLIVNKDDGLIKTRSRAKQSMYPTTLDLLASASYLDTLYTQFIEA